MSIRPGDIPHGSAVARADIVVVDTSLTVKWVLDEEWSHEAAQLRNRWEQRAIQPVVPSWFACEVSNVLYQRIKSGDISLSDAQFGMSAILSAVFVYGDTPADAERALTMAHDSGQRATYDSQFAALAERLGCELWTADDRFRDAMRSTFPWIHSLSEVRRPATDES